MMVLFGENPQVSEFVKGMDMGLELLGFDCEEEMCVVSEGKMVDGLNEKKVDALTTGKKTTTTEACTPWLTLRSRMTPHKHMHGESGKA